MIDSRLTEILVCPICKGPLRMDDEKTKLMCAKCAKGFPIKDNIPMMLSEEAHDLTEEEIQAARVNPVSEES